MINIDFKLFKKIELKTYSHKKQSYRVNYIVKSIMSSKTKTSKTKKEVDPESTDESENEENEKTNQESGNEKSENEGSDTDESESEGEKSDTEKNGSEKDDGESEDEEDVEDQEPEQNRVHADDFDIDNLVVEPINISRKSRSNMSYAPIRYKYPDGKKDKLFIVAPGIVLNKSTRIPDVGGEFRKNDDSCCMFYVPDDRTNSGLSKLYDNVFTPLHNKFHDEIVKNENKDDFISQIDEKKKPVKITEELTYEELIKTISPKNDPKGGEKINFEPYDRVKILFDTEYVADADADDDDDKKTDKKKDKKKDSKKDDDDKKKDVSGKTKSELITTMLFINNKSGEPKRTPEKNPTLNTFRKHMTRGCEIDIVIEIRNVWVMSKEVKIKGNKIQQLNCGIKVLCQLMYVRKSPAGDFSKHPKLGNNMASLFGARPNERKQIKDTTDTDKKGASKTKDKKSKNDTDTEVKKTTTKKPKKKETSNDESEEDSKQKPKKVNKKESESEDESSDEEDSKQKPKKVNKEESESEGESSDEEENPKQKSKKTNKKDESDTEEKSKSKKSNKKTSKKKQENDEESDGEKETDNEASESSSDADDEDDDDDSVEESPDSSDNDSGDEGEKKSKKSKGKGKGKK